eukprot:11090188-Alexandrium_andersonii.AAC.1
MSASLVGSEMCIRDSSWRPSASWPAGLPQRRAAANTSASTRQSRTTKSCLLYTSDAADDM